MPASSPIHAPEAPTNTNASGATQQTDASSDAAPAAAKAARMGADERDGVCDSMSMA
ncbi:MAG: hypothetical protein V4757_01925 [Pseudomonadota bacterium]